MLLLCCAAACAVACGAHAPSPNAPVSAPAQANAGAGNGGAAIIGTAELHGAMKPIAPSAMAPDLQAIGLDPKALPPIDKLEPDKLRKLMKTFTKSLGVVCTDCHVENDFAAPTPRKRIAAQMWDRFVRPLATSNDALLYCDSCHQGSIGPLLDRHDKKALSIWMGTNYVDALKRRDAQEHSCETCHGDPFEGKFVAAWANARGPAK